jgi:enterochelin esterase-like enzyme
VVLVAAAWLVGGISAAYAYVHDYWVRRGFPALATPVGVARGTLRTVRFYSPAVRRQSRYLVYLPPGYGSGKRFGVVYLLHGAPGSMSAFTHIDAIEVRMNTLIAEHRVRPMILVMPAGQQGLFNDDEWANARDGRWADYVMDVVRDVDKRFETLANRRHRAIAGLSEGAYGALNIGLRHLATFSVIESWSGYFVQTPTGPFADATPAELAANSPFAYVPTLAARIHRLGLRAWLLQGRTDWRSPAEIRAFADELHAAGADVRYGFFPGGHDWGLWRAQTPRMLIAVSRWFGQRPRETGFAYVGSALTRAQLIRYRHKRCLALRPGRHVHLHPACAAYRAAHGLPNFGSAPAPLFVPRHAGASSRARTSDRPRRPRSDGSRRRAAARGPGAGSRRGSASRRRRRRSRRRSARWRTSAAAAARR